VQPTERFSNRVENYRKYRPGYPAAILETLRAECGLTPQAVVADIGSGTGILAEMFLKAGNAVIGVEPNKEMREAGERLLSAYPRFTSMDGKAEAIGLADTSVDFITAAQSLHWFDLVTARREFQRILKPEGWVAILWNDRRDKTPFMQAYRALLLRHATDYLQVDHKRITPDVLRGFYAGEFRQRKFDNHQTFDYQGLRGRLLSSSYVPLDNGAMLEELQGIFAEHQVDRTVRFDYVTALYYGKV
jgi:SAM-dependent methyltransferase